MRRYFITYGNKAYSDSKKRILDEALQTGVFDETSAYGPEDLSASTLKSPLMQYQRGGGYWIWKPDIIYQTLSRTDNDDIVVYADSGCSLFPSIEWDDYFGLLGKYDILVFRLNCINKKYTKKKVIDDYIPINGKWWGSYYQIAATVIILKKTAFSVSFINEWKRLCTFDNIFDVSVDEKICQCHGFVEHRHDQSILTALVYKYFRSGKIHISWNHFENRDKGQCIWSSRISNDGQRNHKTEMNGGKMLLKKYILQPIRTFRQKIYEFINSTIK
ncbi:hypothetical protein [Segatella copri]|uniref:hypothetical protein n=1 Tax=Segatella copri TaxID=165179 RepID=UPI001F311F33|nr:hypothetical protein [Segatella copri]